MPLKRCPIRSCGLMSSNGTLQCSNCGHAFVAPDNRMMTYATAILTLLDNVPIAADPAVTAAWIVVFQRAHRRPPTISDFRRVGLTPPVTP